VFRRITQFPRKLKKVQVLEKTLNSWKRGKLTVFGRIKIVETLGLFILIYTVLTTPQHLIDEMNAIILDLI